MPASQECTTTTTVDLSYRPDIDGLRAVAVLSVVGFHVSPHRLTGGFVGVDVFFVISGFLITTIVLRGLENGTFGFVDFYARRARRIFPALLLMLGVTLAAGWLLLLDDELRQLGKHIAAGAGFVSNLVLWRESGYFDPAAEMKPLLHLWSLGIEEQFYLFWPLALWASWKQRIQPLVLAGALLLVSFAVSVGQSFNDPTGAFFSPLSRFWELLIGGVLAMLVATPRRPLGLLATNLVATAGVGLLGCAFALLDKTRTFPGAWALLPSLGTALIILAGPNAWFNRQVLSRRLLVWFGLISFPLYLWHWPILAVMRSLEGAEVTKGSRLAAVILSVFLSWLTWVGVERRIRHRTEWRRLPLALAGLMFGFGGLGLYVFNAPSILRPFSPHVANKGSVGHDDFFAHLEEHAYPCTPKALWLDAESDGRWNGSVRCFQSSPGEDVRVAIVGDSHAEHLFPGLASSLPDMNIAYYARGDLPLLGSTKFSKIFETIQHSATINTVILAAKWDAKLKNESLADFENRLRSTLVALTSGGKKVVLVDDVPEFQFMPSRCKYMGRLAVTHRCEQADPQLTSHYWPTIEQVAQSINGVRVSRIYPLFCQLGVCSMSSGGNVLFRDPHHLNTTGSLRVGSSLASTFRSGDSAGPPTPPPNAR